MKNSIAFAVMMLTAVLFSSSCKKKIETCKLGKHYATDGTSTPAGGGNVFVYDAAGRISKITYSNKSIDSLVRVADTLWVFNFSPDYFLVSLLQGITNGAGNVTSATKTSYDLTGAVTGTESYLYEYNATGNLTQKTTSTSGGTSILTLTYTGSNSVSGLLYNGVNLEKKYFFYHGTIENKSQIDDFNSVVTPYLGKPSAQLLDSAHVILSATSDTLRVQYTHTLDANDYVTKTVESWLTPVVNTTYHTYQYFGCEE